MVKINLPVSEKEIRRLRVGDEVLLSGIMVTARDRAHLYLTEKKRDELQKFLQDGAIYHCGPVMKKQVTGWEVIAAGPTTSTREEFYESSVIKNYQVKVIIGKGGMGETTSLACKKYGAIYLQAVGGLAQLLAKTVIKVIDVFKLAEFGMPEAIWIWEVKDFPGVVTMDSKGNSLHKEILIDSQKKLGTVLSNIISEQ